MRFTSCFWRRLVPAVWPRWRLRWGPYPAPSAWSASSGSDWKACRKPHTTTLKLDSISSALALLRPELCREQMDVWWPVDQFACAANWVSGIGSVQKLSGKTLTERLSAHICTWRYFCQLLICPCLLSMRLFQPRNISTSIHPKKLNIEQRVKKIKGNEQKKFAKQKTEAICLQHKQINFLCTIGYKLEAMIRGKY